MWLRRTRFQAIACCSLVVPCIFACAAACAQRPSSATSPQASPPSQAEADLVVAAGARLVAAFRTGGPAAAIHGARVWRYRSGEDLLADLEAGRRADVVEVCSNRSAERLARDGLLRPLDTRRIEAWDRLHPALKDLPGVVVDGKVYFIPCTASVTGIIYDPRAVSTPPDSFHDLFSRRFKGHLSFADDSALAFEIAALRLGFPDPGALTAGQTIAAQGYLKRHANDIRLFWHDLDDLARAFKAGHVTAAIGDRRAAAELRRRGVHVSFALACEGQPLTACGLALTSQARDLDSAYTLINALLEPADQAALAAATGEAPANRDAGRWLKPGQRARLGLGDMDRLERPVARVPELEHLDWVQAWYEVKTGRG